MSKLSNISAKSQQVASSPSRILPFDVTVRTDDSASSTFHTIVVRDYVFHCSVSLFPLEYISWAQDHARLWCSVDLLAISTNILIHYNDVRPFIQSILCQVKLLLSLVFLNGH